MENSSTESLAKHYTEDMYATRDEVRRGLNTSLDDAYWQAILAYRSRYNKTLGLTNIASKQYSVCYTPTLNNKISDFDLRISKCQKSFMDLNEECKASVRFKCQKDVISFVGQFYGESFNEDFLSTVINNAARDIQGLSQSKILATNYFEAHKLVSEKKNVIDVDFLVKLYTTISQEDNLTSLYRNFDFDANNASVINREYNGLPSALIEKHMNEFYEFITNENVSTIVKATASYYFINYVKPFPKFNNEIALLVFKAVINNSYPEQIGYLLSFEELLKSHENLMDDFKETSRSLDLTYVLSRVLTHAIGTIESFLDNCTNAKISDLRREHSPKAEENSKKEVVSPSEAKISEKEIVPTQQAVGKIAMPVIESGLEEKDAHKFEKYLLEKNPTLKPAQAHFYARHCTLGSFYTIQNYKKEEKVVYETARTSMDALSNLGFYEKRQIKNKFVYTPIKQEANK